MWEDGQLSPGHPRPGTSYPDPRAVRSTQTLDWEPCDETLKQTARLGILDHTPRIPTVYRGKKTSSGYIQRTIQQTAPRETSLAGPLLSRHDMDAILRVLAFSPCKFKRDGRSQSAAIVGIIAHSRTSPWRRVNHPEIGGRTYLGGLRGFSRPTIGIPSRACCHHVLAKLASHGPSSTR